MSRQLTFEDAALSRAIERVRTAPHGMKTARKRELKKANRRALEATLSARATTGRAA